MLIQIFCSGNVNYLLLLSGFLFDLSWFLVNDILFILTFRRRSIGRQYGGTSSEVVHGHRYFEIFAESACLLKLGFYGVVTERVWRSGWESPILLRISFVYCVVWFSVSLSSSVFVQIWLYVLALPL